MIMKAKVVIMKCLIDANHLTIFDVNYRTLTKVTLASMHRNPITFQVKFHLIHY